MKRSRQSLIVIALLILSIGIASRALAHDGSWDVNFASWDPCTLGHDDEDPFKGWAIVTVTNIMSEDWGDFHFEVYEPLSYDVVFSDTNDPFEMLDSIGDPYTDFSYTISGDQKEIDFEFYDNPVLNSETVTFKVYTDNTANEHAWFGLIVYPTPVPEPMTIALLGLGGLVLLRKR